MLETVYSIKNNRDSAETKQEREKATRTRITLHDIHNIDTNGRWWVLGAQYKPVKQTEVAKVKRNSMSRVLATADPKVLKVAEKLHMNTDIRKWGVFVEFQF